MSEALAGAAETFDGYRSGRRRTPSCDPRSPPRRQARRRGSEARDSCAITPLERTIAHALAVDPRVDDDTIAVECFAGGHVVLPGSAAVFRA